MSALGKLVASIVLDTAEFTVGADKAQFTAAKAANTIDRSFKDLESSVKGALGGIAGALAAGFTISALKDTFDDVVKFRVALENMSQVTGASVSSLSILGQGARLAGTDLGTVEQALVKMVKGLSTADPASKDAGRALEYLGVSSRTASGQLKDPGEIMLDIAKKLGQMEDGANKTAIATALWGKTGAQLLPTMKALAENGDLLAKVTVQQAQEAKTYEQALIRLNIAQGAIGKTIMSEMVAPLTTLVQMLTTAATGADSLGYAVKGMAARGELTTWAAQAGGAIASTVDMALLLKNTLMALGSSVAVVFADVATVALAPLATLTGNLGALLDLRNSVLAKANENWATLLNQDINKTREAYDTKLQLNITLNKALSGAFDDQVSRAAAASARLKDAFVLNDKDVKDRMDRIKKAYDQELLSLVEKGKYLEQQLVLGRALTASEKDLADILAGKYAKYTPMQQAALERQALYNKSKEEEIRLLAVANTMLGEYIKGQEAINALHEKALAIASNMESTVAASIDQAKFDLEMVGKSQIEIAKLTEIRKIELQVRKEIAALPEVEGKVDQAALDRILAAGNAAKEALPNFIEQSAALKQQIGLWDSVSTSAGNFFADLILHGKSAFDSLKNSLKSFAAEILAFFAKKYILEMVAGASGTFGAPAANAATSALGGMGNSLIGTGLSAAGTYLFGTGATVLGASGTTIGAGAGMMLGGAAGEGAVLAGSAGAIGAGATGASTGVMAALASNPVGWIALAVLAAYAIFSQKGGGPKTSGTGISDVTGGIVTDGTISDVRRFYNTDDKSLDTMVQKVVTATAASFDTLLKKFGGTSGTVTFTQSTDTDPQGTASNRVATQVFMDGVKVFQQTMENLGRDGAKVGPEMQIQAERALIAALQASKLPTEMAAIFAGVVTATMTESDYKELIARATDLQLVLDVVAKNTLPGFTVAVAKSMQGAGESLGQTASRVAAQWDALNSVFATGDDKVNDANKAISNAFAAIGVGVPQGAEAFSALVKSIDLSTDAGRALFDTMVMVGPAFKMVTDAAGTALHDLQSAIGSRNTGYARSVTLQERNDLAGQFAMATGGTFGEDLLAQMALHPETFQGLTIDAQRLLTRFLALQTQLENYDKQLNVGSTTVKSGGSTASPGTPPLPGQMFDGTSWIFPGRATSTAIVTAPAPVPPTPAYVNPAESTVAPATSAPTGLQATALEAQMLRQETYLVNMQTYLKRMQDILLATTQNGTSIRTTAV